MSIQPNLSGWRQFTFPQLVTNSTSWMTVGHFGYEGSDILGIPTKIKIIAGIIDAGAVAGVRVYDLTNVLQIAKSLTITDDYPDFCDIGTLTNVSTGAAVWGVQVKKVSGNPSDEVAAGSLALKF